jgi:hypothetical protein
MKTVFQAVPTILPKLVPVGLLLLGLILGFIWAYGISPVVYTAAEPVNLGESWKQEYVKQVAWQLAASGDMENAKRQLSYLGDADKVLQDTVNANQNDPNLKPKLDQLATLAVANQVELAKIKPGLFNSNYTPFLCVALMALAVGGLVVLNTLVPVGTLFSRQQTGASTAGVVSGQEAERRKVVEAAKAQKTDFAATAPDRGKPIAQFMSSYLLNDDFFDDSFPIETESSEFLGETGAGIAAALGSGTPKKVTAVEAWVFDKNDIKTVTKVLMSDYAYNNDGLRAQLAAKGEAVLLKPGLVTTIETTTLTIQVRVVNLQYESGAEGDSTFFKQLTLEIAAWPKKAPAVASMPTNDPFGGTARVMPPPTSMPPPPPGAPN